MRRAREDVTAGIGEQLRPFAVVPRGRVTRGPIDQHQGRPAETGYYWARSGNE